MSPEQWLETLEARGRDWPWDSGWFKPTSDRIDMLKKAGALLAAEIDRLQRLEKAP